MTGILHLVETATTASVGTQRTHKPSIKVRCNERSFYIRKKPSWSNKCSVVTQKSKNENKEN